MYMILMPLIIFAFGLLIGSFLNVVILRMNTGRSVVVGRSKCAHCNRELTWYELIPVFSYLGIGGKCRTCRVSISFQYPLVELTTAIVFVMLYTHYVIGSGFAGAGLVYFVFSLIIAALLIVISVYDIRHKIIPDTIVYPFIVLALISLFWRVSMGMGSGLWIELLGGVLVALPFFLLWYFSKGRLMGFGDVKLALGIGWLVGLEVGYAVFLLAFWIGAVVGLFLLALTKRYGMKSEIPFGPFLIIGLCIAVVWSVTINSLFPLWPL